MTTKMNARVEIKPQVEAAPLKLDLGCGKNKKEGFIGIDQYAMQGVDAQADLTASRWVFNTSTLGSVLLHFCAAKGRPDAWELPDNSVDEVHCSHFVEHLDFNKHNPERVRFFNELYRVMKPGSKALIVTPHWASDRAYGDFTHGDKPVCEFFYFYVSPVWREQNAPHTDVRWNPQGFNCNFDAQWGHGMRQDLWNRHLEYQQYALTNYKGAATDLIATLTKLPLK